MMKIYTINLIVLSFLILSSNNNNPLLQPLFVNQYKLIH